MIFFKILFVGILVILIGGFSYFAFLDVPIHQSEKVETLTAADFQN